MRMWMVDPKIMCRKHLLGEHVECHMILSTLRSGKSIAGCIRNNCIEPKSVKDRHDELASEMSFRGYNHKSPMELESSEPVCFPGAIVDKQAALNMLLDRCLECKKDIK